MREPVTPELLLSYFGLTPASLENGHVLLDNHASLELCVQVERVNGKVEFMAGIAVYGEEEDLLSAVYSEIPVLDILGTRWSVIRNGSYEDGGDGHPPDKFFEALEEMFNLYQS